MSKSASVSNWSDGVSERVRMRMLRKAATQIRNLRISASSFGVPSGSEVWGFTPHSSKPSDQTLQKLRFAPADGRTRPLPFWPTRRQRAQRTSIQPSDTTNRLCSCEQRVFGKVFQISVLCRRRCER